MSTHFIAAAQRTFRELHGVVVSAGLMQRTVKVRVGHQVYSNRVQKLFNKPQTYLVHDPNDSVRTGDVVAISAGWRTSKHKRHVLKHIISPAQIPLEDRPPVQTEAERWEAALQKRAAKEDRRSVIKAERAAVKEAETQARRKNRKQTGDQAKKEQQPEQPGHTEQQ